MSDSTSVRFGAPLYSADGSDEIDFANQVNAVTNAFDAGAALLSQAFPSGGLMLSAAQSPPDGWLRCDGSAVSRATYADLFAAISTVYGAGDGSTTFNVPDFRGRTLVGAGSGTGLTSRSVGDKGGAETVALAKANLPAYNLPVTDPGHEHTYSQVEAGLSGLAATSAASWGGATGDTGTSVTGITVGSGGSNTPHENMPPYGVCNVFIKV